MRRMHLSEYRVGFSKVPGRTPLLHSLFSEPPIASWVQLRVLATFRQLVANPYLRPSQLVLSQIPLGQENEVGEFISSCVHNCNKQVPCHR